MITLRLMLAFMGLLGIGLIVVALRGALARKPLLVSSRAWTWGYSAFLLVFLSYMVETYLRYPSTGIPWANIFIFALFGISAGFQIWQPPIYMAFGVTEDRLYGALRSALHKLDFAYEESPLRLKLTSLDATLRIGRSPINGVATVAIGERKHSSTMKTIARAIGEALSAEPGPVNWTTAIVFTVLGVVVLVFAGFMVYELVGVLHL